MNTPCTSSAGRLFDAVSSLLGLCHEAAYEGQAAILLETAARRHFARAGLPSPTEVPAWTPYFDEVGDQIALPSEPFADVPGQGPPTEVPLTPFGRAILVDAASGSGVEVMAGRFHHALAWVTAAAAESAAAEHDLDTVALGGGVFQNMLFLELLVARLEHRGLRVLVHRAVPTNDGGLCLGQAETVAALLRTGATVTGGAK